MDLLVSHTPFVLAGIGSDIDTNVATAMTTIGSILGVVDEFDLDISAQTFLVQGVGKVGSNVARTLVQLGAKKVITCDVVPDRAAIDGCEPLKNYEDWKLQDVDFLVPCGNSLAIDESVVERMPTPR